MQPLVDLHVERAVQPCEPLGHAPAAALQVGRRERRVEVRQVRAARGFHDLRHHFLELLRLAVVVQVRQVVREDGAREEVEDRGERRAADVHRRAVAREPADVVHEQAHLLATEVPERVQPVRREELPGHDLPEGAPARRGVGQPHHGAPGVGADGVRHGPRGEGGVMPLQELARDVRGGRDHRGDRAQAEGHERAVDLREAREGAVRLVAEEVEVADEGQRARPRWEAAASMRSETEEVDGGEEGGEKPWQPREQLGHSICKL
jgi:hypothetical protein